MRRFKAKQSSDGRYLLNFGCGSRIHRDWNNVDFSAYAFLRNHTWIARIGGMAGIISAKRMSRLESMDAAIVRADLRKGLPYGQDTFDVVYSSHTLEHFPVGLASFLIEETLRVLKPGGVLRLVVPDLEQIAALYQGSVERLKKGADGADDSHRAAVSMLFEQMVRREPAGTGEQKGLAKLFDRLLLGSAARRGELHRWMYDYYSLAALLESRGIVDTRKLSYQESGIDRWCGFGLDHNSAGAEYKPYSLYIEGRKPS